VIRYRSADPDDVEAIARLHADSWRRSYRGMYSDEYLDRDAEGERLTAWRSRFSSRGPNEHTTVAVQNGEVVGFVHTILDDDPQWGALLDNLHVRHDLRRSGVGTRLMAESAKIVLAHSPSSGLFLSPTGPRSASTTRAVDGASAGSGRRCRAARWLSRCDTCGPNRRSFSFRR